MKKGTSQGHVSLQRGIHSVFRRLFGELLFDDSVIIALLFTVLTARQNE